MDPWIYAPPDFPGWYATESCWDTAEGIFPGANYWNGVEWDEQVPILSRSPWPFDTRSEAMEWARAHDMETSA